MVIGLTRPGGQRSAQVARSNADACDAHGLGHRPDSTDPTGVLPYAFRSGARPAAGSRSGATAEGAAEPGRVSAGAENIRNG
jgi:hypothetical protein